jgi:gluconate 2-dehydrogenase
LKENKIAGAALDVFCKEPALPDNPLFSLKNIVVAPHISSAGVLTREKMSVMVAENIIAALSGNKPKNLLNNI